MAGDADGEEISGDCRGPIVAAAMKREGTKGAAALRRAK